MFDANEIIPQEDDWITFIFLMILMILVVVKIAYNDRLYHTGTLFFSKKYLSIYFNKEKTNVINWFQFSLFFVQLLTISLFLSLIISYLRPDFATFGISFFVFVLIRVLIYFGFRFSFGVFLAFIFDLKNLHKKIVFEKINYFNNLIMWLLPFLLFLVYSKNNQQLFLKIALFIFVLMLIIRYGLLLKNNKKLIFSNFFYFILYFCALEIVPLVIILKLSI